MGRPVLPVALAALILACATGESARATPAPSSATAGREATAAPQLAAFFGATKGARTVMAAEVKASLPAEKYFIVDVRSAEDYAKGHVPGAVNLPLDQLFSDGSLAKLPKAGGKPILLVCHTGHTASMALGGLAALGYEPWVMRWSMMAWNPKTDVKIAAADEKPQGIVGLGGPVER